MFKHCLEEKSLHAACWQRTRPIGVRIEKDRIVAAGKAAKFVRKRQANGHQPFPIELGTRMPAPMYRACHYNTLST